MPRAVKRERGRLRQQKSSSSQYPTQHHQRGTLHRFPCLLPDCQSASVSFPTPLLKGKGREEKGLTRIFFPAYIFHPQMNPTRMFQTPFPPSNLSSSTPSQCIILQDVQITTVAVGFRTSSSRLLQIIKNYPWTERERGKGRTNDSTKMLTEMSVARIFDTGTTNKTHHVSTTTIHLLNRQLIGLAPGPSIPRTLPSVRNFGERRTSGWKGREGKEDEPCYIPHF